MTPAITSPNSPSAEEHPPHDLSPGGVYQRPLEVTVSPPWGSVRTGCWTDICSLLIVDPRSSRLPDGLRPDRTARCCVPQHSGLNRILRIGWRMPPPDKGKCRVTIYPITIYHRPQFGRDRIAAALPAAAAVATSPCLQSEFCPLPSDSAGTYPCTWRKARRKLLRLL